MINKENELNKRYCKIARKVKKLQNERNEIEAHFAWFYRIYMKKSNEVNLKLNRAEAQETKARKEWYAELDDIMQNANTAT